MIIKNISKKWYRKKVEKTVLDMLKTVPFEHRIGIDTIYIVDNLRFGPGRNRVAGLYKKLKKGKSEIYISVDNYVENIPSFLLLIPIIRKMIVAKVLFHEIGHHYKENFSNMIKEKNNENYAESYSKSLMQKRFWIIKLVLSPFKRFFN